MDLVLESIRINYSMWDSSRMVIGMDNAYFMIMIITTHSLENGSKVIVLEKAFKSRTVGLQYMACSKIMLIVMELYTSTASNTKVVLHQFLVASILVK